MMLLRMNPFSIILLLCIWLGGLLRKVLENPAKWFEVLMLFLVPIMYLCLVLIPFKASVWPGFEMKMATFFIMGFIALPVAEKVGQWNILLVLFLLTVSVVLYRYGVKWAYAVTLERNSEWCKLFYRLVKFIPFAAAMFFWQALSFSKQLQWLGDKKWFCWIVVVLAIASVIFICSHNIYPWMISGRYMLPYMLAVHPLTVFLVICLLKGLIPTAKQLLFKA